MMTDTREPEIGRELDRLEIGIQRALAAWERIKSDSYWNDWVEIGETLSDGRTAMLRKLGMNEPTGKKWSDNFGQWLKETGLSNVADKASRSRLIDCMLHRVEIEAWRATLRPEERARYNHPTTVWRQWKKATQE